MRVPARPVEQKSLPETSVRRDGPNRWALEVLFPENDPVAVTRSHKQQQRKR
jgi:hypothetical protein